MAQLTPWMEGDPSRCGGSAKDIDLVLHSCTDHLEVRTRRQPGQRCRHGVSQGWICSHIRVSALKCLPCCGCPVCKDERQFWHIPVTVPSLQDAAILMVLGLMQVVRAEVPLAAITPALGLQHNSSPKSFLVRHLVFADISYGQDKSSELCS